MKPFTYRDVEIEVWDDVFFPTETTKLILDYLSDRTDLTGKKVLDLGCGSGVVGLTLAKRGVVSTLSASDLSERAIQNAKANSEKLRLSADLRACSLYEGWKGLRFDYVICDVSGVAEELARVSSWFGASVPCNSGRDGTDLVLRIIQETPAFLNSNGHFLMPVLTLSNHKKIVQELERRFGTVTQVASKQFYLPKDLATQGELIRRLNTDGSIETEEKFGFHLWKTMLYETIQ